MSSTATSNAIPQRENNKFIVLKMEDVTALGATFEINLRGLLMAIERHRKGQGKGENKYFVCNQDEPYADKVMAVIMDGELEKAGIDQDQVWTCGICGAIKRYDAERPFYDAECGECCPEHYHGEVSEL